MPMKVIFVHIEFDFPAHVWGGWIFSYCLLVKRPTKMMKLPFGLWNSYFRLMMER